MTVIKNSVKCNLIVISNTPRIQALDLSYLYDFNYD